jgi:protein-S-isoprenylcysteine O-methyltransferase Ste14
VASGENQLPAKVFGDANRQGAVIQKAPRSGATELSMTQIDNQMSSLSPQVAGSSRILGFIAFLYGIAAYLVFVVTILYAIGFVMGLVVPKSIDTGTDTPAVEAVIINLLLMMLFAVQHSVMARKRFKAWWTQFVPRAVERSTYVLLASLSLLLLFWQWRPMPEVIWNIEDADLAVTLVTLSFAGWVLVFLSTFAINHFELFGLQQVTHNLTDKPAAAPQFRTPLFYKFVRHPLYLGFIIAVWAAPVMTVGHMLFSVVITLYILVGTALEERDLIALFGDDYRRYKQRVGMIIPWRKSA